MNADVQRREIATARALGRSSPVLSASAGQLRGATADELATDVGATLEPGANVIRISAQDEQQARSAQVANVVANTFLAIRRGVIRAHLQATSVDLRRQLGQLQADPQQQQAAIALRRRIGQLAVSEAIAGRDLGLAASATAPQQPLGSHGLRNTLIALGVALLLGVAIVVGRERVAPRARDTRQLRDLLESPMLAEIPHNPGRRGRARGGATVGEHGGYRALGAALDGTGDACGPRVVVVTSGCDGDGKTSVSANLGRVLQQAGSSVLLVDADMRRPALHTAFDAAVAPGLGELLEERASNGWPTTAALPAGTIATLDEAANGGPDLSIIAAGGTQPDRGTPLTRAAAEALIARLRREPFDYVVIDAPTLPAAAAAQALARVADAVLIVTRLHSTRVERLSDVRDTLERLGVVPAGFVAIGTAPQPQARRERGERGEAAEQ
jgi:Mrp family chromosome partitioning ATPase